jgi:hypothetical protein
MRTFGEGCPVILIVAAAVFGAAYLLDARRTETRSRALYRASLER